MKSRIYLTFFIVLCFFATSANDTVYVKGNDTLNTLPVNWQIVDTSYFDIQSYETYYDTTMYRVRNADGRYFQKYIIYDRVKVYVKPIWAGSYKGHYGEIELGGSDKKLLFTIYGSWMGTYSNPEVEFYLNYGDLLKIVEPASNQSGNTGFLADVSLARLVPDTLVVFYIDYPQGIEKLKRDVTIAPNPTLSDLNFNFGNIFPTQVDFQVFDMSGRMVKQGQLFGNNTNTMNVSDLNTGVYMINLNIDGEIMNRQFVKE